MKLTVWMKRSIASWGIFPREMAGMMRVVVLVMKVESVTESVNGGIGGGGGGGACCCCCSAIV